LSPCGQAIFSVFRGGNPGIGTSSGRYDNQIHCSANPKDVWYSAVGRIEIGKDETLQGVGMEPFPVRYKGNCAR
jgi:hypothetical protein